MRNIVWILFVAVLASCQDVTIGFLNVEKAGYEIDSLEVKAVLDNAVPKLSLTRNTSGMLTWDLILKGVLNGNLSHA